MEDRRKEDMNILGLKEEIKLLIDNSMLSLEMKLQGTIRESIDTAMNAINTAKKDNRAFLISAAALLISFSGLAVRFMI